MSECKGLKSLKGKISKGHLVICETDKSKRFAALTKQQYIESGLQHAKKDLEIEPHRVKRIQNTVNHHVWWVKEMTKVGSN